MVLRVPREIGLRDSASVGWFSSVECAWSKCCFQAVYRAVVDATSCSREAFMATLCAELAEAALGVGVSMFCCVLQKGEVGFCNLVIGEL